jgi:hypothetical protein
MSQALHLHIPPLFEEMHTLKSLQMGVPFLNGISTESPEFLVNWLNYSENLRAGYSFHI